MNVQAIPATGSPSDVDAYCSTGTSPGRSGQATISFVTTYGGLTTARVGYEVHGAARGSPVLVLGGISAGCHIYPTALNSSPGWWPGVVGPGGALDPRLHRLVGIDYVGSSTSPLNAVHPLSTHDQARALAAVLDHLDIDAVTLVGSSYGGMVALAFAALYPARAKRLVLLCAAHRTHPMATALRAIQRRTVRFARTVGQPAEGLALARSLAMTTYRSAIEFDVRFDSVPEVTDGVAHFPVESYLEARGRDFAQRFDAEGFLTLSESIDMHDVDPSDVVVPTTLVSFDTDQLVPPWLVDELAGAAPGVTRHVRLPSRFGHDAFLKEVDLVSDVIRAAVDGLEVVR